MDISGTRGGGQSGRQFGGNLAGKLRIQVQYVICRVIHANDPNVCLVGQANQMSKHTDLAAARLYLTKHDMRGIQRGGNSPQIPLVAWEPQNLSIADNAVLVVALGGQLFDKVVGQRVGKD